AVRYIFCRAEDGRRARNVTGVQTCALPIYASQSSCPQPQQRIDDEEDHEADPHQGQDDPDADRDERHTCDCPPRRTGKGTAAGSDAESPRRIVLGPPLPPHEVPHTTIEAMPIARTNRTIWFASPNIDPICRSIPHRASLAAGPSSAKSTRSVSSIVSGSKATASTSAGKLRCLSWTTQAECSSAGGRISTRPAL